MSIQRFLTTILLLGTLVSGVAWAEPLSAAKAGYQQSEEVWIAEGVVEAVNQATVTSKTAGTIVEVNFDVNDFVKKGDVLMRFRGESNAAGLRMVEAGLKEAKARQLEAQREHGRIKELFAKKMVTAAQMDQAEAGLNAAQARVDSASAQTVSASEGVSDTVVRAPYSGYVTKRFVQLGENANVGTPLFAGLSLDALRVITAVPKSVLLAVREHNRAMIHLINKPGPALAAENIVIFPYADSQSRQFSVRLGLPEKLNDLFPGEMVKVHFVIGQKKRLLIPSAAVVIRGETAGVYVLDNQGAPSLRHIMLGSQINGEQYEVLAGLTEGDTVATNPILAGQVVFNSRKGSHP